MKSTRDVRDRRSQLQISGSYDFGVNVRIWGAKQSSSEMHSDPIGESQSIACFTPELFEALRTYFMHYAAEFLDLFAKPFDFFLRDAVVL